MSSGGDLNQFSEKRRYKRCAIDARAVVIHRGQYLNEIAVDVSEGGMRVRVLKPYEIGETIEVCFFLGNGAFIEEVGEVAYSYVGDDGERYIGVRYPKPSRTNQTLIRQFVEAN